MSENRPLSPWAYFGYSLLFNIPFAGFIVALVLSFSADNINLKNFARSYFCGLILVLIFIGICFACGLGTVLFTVLNNLV